MLALGGGVGGGDETPTIDITLLDNQSHEDYFPNLWVLFVCCSWTCCGLPKQSHVKTLKQMSVCSLYRVRQIWFSVSSVCMPCT